MPRPQGRILHYTLDNNHYTFQTVSLSYLYDLFKVVKDKAVGNLPTPRDLATCPCTASLLFATFKKSIT
jgi:hypothetical protein